jgi:hypothetical protein
VIISDNSPNLIGLQLAKQFFIENPSGIEIVFVDNRMNVGISQNSNVGVRKANSDLVHVLHQDDFLYSMDAYQIISSMFQKNLDCRWLFIGRKMHEHFISPVWDFDLQYGINSLGGPSCMVARSDFYALYREEYKFLTDVVLYLNMYEKLGIPTLLNEVYVEIDTTGDRVSNLLSEDSKTLELIDLLKDRSVEISKDQILNLLFRSRQLEVCQRLLNAAREGDFISEKDFKWCLRRFTGFKFLRKVKRSLRSFLKKVR